MYVVWVWRARCIVGQRAGTFVDLLQPAILNSTIQHLIAVQVWIDERAVKKNRAGDFFRLRTEVSISISYHSITILNTSTW